MLFNLVHLRRWGLPTLSLAALGFIASTLWQSPLTIETLERATSWRGLALAMLPCLAMLVAKAILQTLLIENHQVRGSWWPVLAAYAQGQLIRYLPGKVWGIVYQGERLIDRAPRAVIWHANISQIFATTLNGVAVMLGIVLYKHAHVLAGALAIGLGMAATWWVLRSGILAVWLRLMVKLGLPIEFGHAQRINAGRALVQVWILQFDWLAYFLAWVLLVGETYDAAAAIWIGTLYAGASLIGLLVIVMPSGWLVREAAFIWLGGMQQMPAAELLVLGLIARAFFTVGDGLCAALLVGINFKVRGPTDGHS